MIASIQEVLEVNLNDGKTGYKNVHLVSKHCYKTSWKATLRVVQPTFKPFSYQIMQVAARSK